MPSRLERKRPRALPGAVRERIGHNQASVDEKLHAVVGSDEEGVVAGCRDADKASDAAGECVAAPLHGRRPRAVRIVDRPGDCDGERLEGGEHWHLGDAGGCKAELRPEPGPGDAWVGLEERGICAEGELERIAESVAVRIKRRINGIERIESVRDLPSVGKSVTVGVGRERVCTRDILAEVGESVGVEVFRSVASERSERGVLPLVGERVAVRGEPVRTFGGDREVVKSAGVSAQDDFAQRLGGRAGLEAFEYDYAVKVQVPAALIEVDPAGEARPCVLNRRGEQIGAKRRSVEGHRVSLRIEFEVHRSAVRRWSAAAEVRDDVQVQPQDAVG